MAGICDIDIEIAEIMIGENVSKIPKSISDRIYELREDKWFIIDFIEFQYGILNPECRPHKAVIDKLKNKGLYDYYLNNIYPDKRPINNKISSKDRSFIYHRDDYTCQYCGKRLEIKELVIDHIIPLNNNGLNKTYNYVTSCIRCNSSKSDMSLEKYCSSIKNGTAVYKTINTLFNTLLDRVPDTLKDKDKAKDKDKDKEEDKEKDIKFETFWNLYDYKKDYDRCINYWNGKTKIKNGRKINDNDRDEIMKYIPAYVKSTPDKKYRKNPGTFLYNSSWNDELINSNRKSTSKIERSLKAMEDFANEQE